MIPPMKSSHNILCNLWNYALIIFRYFNCKRRKNTHDMIFCSACVCCVFSVVYIKHEGCMIMLSRACLWCINVPPTYVGCWLCFGTEPLCSFSGSSSLPLCNSLPVWALACSFCLCLSLAPVRLCVHCTLRLPWLSLSTGCSTRHRKRETGLPVMHWSDPCFCGPKTPKCPAAKLQITAR